MLRDDEILRAMLDAAIEAAQPLGKFRGHLPDRPKGRTIIVGAGKASANMARAFEEEWGLCEGLVVTRYGHGAPTRFIEIVEASHPVPDAAGLAAADRILALAQTAGPDDLVVCLMSGGASALLSRPAAGIDFATKQAINRALLKCGAPIQAMNAVRRAMSSIKGGRLAAAAAPARLVTYLISDVPGDDPAVIGSGPTIPQTNSIDDVRAILQRYGVALEPALDAAMQANSPGPARGGEVHMLATPMMALEAAARFALGLGITPVILGDAIEGEAREVGTVIAGIARSVRRHAVPARPPCVLLSGGETTVTLKGKGRGGRNTEFLLSLLIGLENGCAGIAALAADTDGIDGVEDNAGAWFDAGRVAEAVRLGLEPKNFLRDNDAYSFFAPLGTLIHTGPTLTNVNDFRAVLIR